MKLRGQLLLATALVAALPLAGLQFVRQVEQLLRQGQEQSLIDNAAALASVLTAEDLPARGVEPLYVQRAGQGLFLDGYGDDWDAWLDRIVALGPDRATEIAAPSEPTPMAPLLLALAESPSGLHLLLRAHDRETRFARDPETPGEEVVLKLVRGSDASATVRRLEIAPAAPGRFTRAGAAGGVLHGDWQVHAGGWNLELRIPGRDRPDALAVTWIDRDRTDQPPTVISSGAPRPLIARDPAADARLAALAPPGTRAWLVHPSGHVLARASGSDLGGAGPESDPGFWQTMLFRRLAGDTTVAQPERDPTTVRLFGAELDHARSHGQGTDWVVRDDAGRGAVRVRAATRLQSGDPAPILVLERDADALMLLANEAVLRLVGASLLSFLAAAAVLLLFAYRLARRIRRLQRDASRAVAPDGSVVGRLKPARGGDELAGLSRRMSELLERLRGQQQYLRTLADKLAHELRTPLSMIGSSLENLDAHLSREAPHDPEAVAAWLARASQGQRRLRRILHAMSEASRLEEALIDEPFERFDLAAMVREYLDGMRAARGPVTQPQIVMDAPNVEVPIDGSPDLIAQLLDKLLDNAQGLTPDNGEIRVRVGQTDFGPMLDVENDGPSIDPTEVADLFEPMVSHRRGAGEMPHLGLGLFIARLIMQRHGGRIDAAPIAEGTRFRMRFPAADIDTQRALMNRKA